MGQHPAIMKKAGGMKTRGRTAPLGWIGLILAVLILPIALSGAALVGGATLDRLLHPDRHAASGSPMLSPDLFVDRVRPVLTPGARVAALTLAGPGEAVVVATTAPVTGARGTDYYLDPSTGHRLAVAGHDAGPVAVLERLHHSLGLGSAGRVIVGALGLALMLSCLTGLYVGWPDGGGWRQVLRHRHRRGRLAAGHHLLGLVSVGPLFLLALTGTWLAMPAPFARLAGAPPRLRSEPSALARPMARPAQPLAVVLGRAADLHPNAVVRTILWPTERDPDWTVDFADARIAPVKVADDTGSATAVSAHPLDMPAAGVLDLHGGRGLGAVWRGVLIVTGLSSAAMTITGLILWRRTRRRPKDQAVAGIDR